VSFFEGGTIRENRPLSENPELDRVWGGGPLIVPHEREANVKKRQKRREPGGGEEGVSS